MKLSDRYWNAACDLTHSDFAIIDIDNNYYLLRRKILEGGDFLDWVIWVNSAKHNRAFAFFMAAEAARINGE
jgi:hypothetical protein